MARTKTTEGSNRRGVVATRLMTAMLTLLLGAAQGCFLFGRSSDSEDIENRVIPTSADYRPGTIGEGEDDAIGATIRPEDVPDESPRPTGLRPAGDKMLVVYFDFDRSEVRPDQLERIDVNLRYLRDTPKAKVLVEGHCDERGTTEYNFVLGERRARSVAEYFIGNGIAEDRIQILSKGEEYAAVPGKTEEAWAKNRRVEFKFFD